MSRTRLIVTCVVGVFQSGFPAFRFHRKPRQTAVMRSIIIFFSVFASVSLSASQVKITYLANEGVMIQCGSDKILVDALFRDSLDQ